MNIFGINKWKFRHSEYIVKANEHLLNQEHTLVGITRVRNEALILKDTLDHMSKHVDAIVVYDDASTDHTLQILRNHPKVALIISNTVWETETLARLNAETRHRALLLQLAQNTLKFKWVLCFDADERYIGNFRSFIAKSDAEKCDGVRIQLFDAYMTLEDHAPYRENQQLLNFRKVFGPERRDILMLWKNCAEIRFEGLDAREPIGTKFVITDFYCQHYGKALSTTQWEDKCDYYIKHFPFETYGKKWLSRRSQAVHIKSDFDRPLYAWGETLFANAVKIN